MFARPRALVALCLALGVLVAACTPSTDQPAPTGSAGSGSSSLAMPLSSFDAEALRAAEANLRRESREKGGISKLGPGGVELASLMDRTASFLLVQLPAKLTALAPQGSSVAFARSTASGSGGRLAAPFIGFEQPGMALTGAYAMTIVGFNLLVADKQVLDPRNTPSTEQCPCTKAATFDPTTDEITVGGNKGTVVTTMSASATLNGSKVSLTITIKVTGEVRDANGAYLYKIAHEATGHADGDVCPDGSGVAQASMAFSVREDYFDASGAKTGTGVISFSGQVRMRADDNAKLAGVDLNATGEGALGEQMIRLAAQSIAPTFEKAWRSGTCIAVLVDPKGGDVEKDSVTTVTVKVKHKTEGNELDKPVVAKLDAGTKSIEPAGSKQKAPATFRYTAGSESGDRGDVSFESVSNRGIGHIGATFSVAGGWTISSTGTSDESVQDFGVVAHNLRALITDLKVTAAKDGTLTGTGTLSLSGEVGIDAAGAINCSGQIDQKVAFTARGVLVGSGPGAILRLKLSTPAAADATVAMTCRLITGAASTNSVPAQGFSDRYGEALGEFDLPADGGTKTVSRTMAIGGSSVNVTATAAFTVAKAK
jgi:hypothetical protein